jgi:DNA-binding LacI/PurR family transcriptional regulator
MGVVAAETLLKRIAGPASAEYPKEIVLEPELVVRESTALKN